MNLMTNFDYYMLLVYTIRVSENNHFITDILAND